MPKAILLSDNELLSDIYKVNLLSYLGLEVLHIEQLSAAKEVLESEKVEIFIGLSTINSQDAGPGMLKIAESHKIPLLIVGEKSTISNTPEVQTVPGNLNIKFFLQSIAKTLGITARDMSSQDIGEYFPIGLKILLGMSTAPCDIYYKVSKLGAPEEYTKVWSEGQPIEESFEKFKDLTILNVFIPADKRLQITNLVTENIKERISDNSLSSEQSLESVESAFELMAQSLFVNPEATEEVLEISSQCIGKLNEILKGESKLSDLLKLMIKNKSRFIYMHSVLTSYVCQYMLEKIPWGSNEHKEKVSYVLFFHDMFLVPIYNDHPDIKYEEDLIFSAELSDNEKEGILNHAKEAGNALKQLSKAPMGADTIVTQHHGSTSGVGFNINPGDDISPLAKIIIVGECFVDEFLKTKDAGNTPSVETIVSELKERYSNKSYLKIVDTLEQIKI